MAAYQQSATVTVTENATPSPPLTAAQLRLRVGAITFIQAYLLKVCNHFHRAQIDQLGQQARQRVANVEVVCEQVI